MAKIINPNVPTIIPQENRIGIDSYIGENPNNIELIERTILTEKVTLIDAPTNSGKSTIMGGLFNKWVNLENRRCYYLLPKVIQQQQFQKTYLQEVPVINMHATDAEKEEAKLFGANITWTGFLQNTYDEGLTSKDIVIVDEAHLLINNQSFINDTKQLVRKLQRGKYKVVLLSGTPNYVALGDLFKCKTLSFYFRTPPIKRLHPVIIDGKLINNVTQYLKSLKWDEDGLNVIRVNDKDKHTEIKQWAVDKLNLTENQIQLVNKDIADPRFPDPDYQYLIENEAIQNDKKLLITTIFADEGINIKNTNIKSIGIFYDPKLRASSQRCRDSAIQFCARFRNLHKIDNYKDFSINLFLPDYSNNTEAHDYYQVLDVQKKTARRLIAQLAQTSKEYNTRLVMQSFPFLTSGTDPQSNLVIEVGKSFYEINEQGQYFNTKNQIDKFKSNAEFLTELSPFFEIGEISGLGLEPDLEEKRTLMEARTDRMTTKVESFRPLKENPDDVIWSIAKNNKRHDLSELSIRLTPTMHSLTEGIEKYDKMLIKTIEDEANWLLFLKSLNFPITEFAGILLHKREFHEKMRFLRFLLSRETDNSGSMNNLYYIANFKPFEEIRGAIVTEFMGKGFHPKMAVKTWVMGKMPYYLKTKGIDANMIISELFDTEETRVTENGQKITYISINRERNLSDVIRDFLFFNEQHYPTIDEGIKAIADDLSHKRHTHNVQQGAYRSNESEAVKTSQDATLGKARVEMDKSKQMLEFELYNNPQFIEKVNAITKEMTVQFKTELNKLGCISRVLDKIDAVDPTHIIGNKTPSKGVA